MIRRSLSSTGLLRLLILMLCAATLTFLWGLHFSQKAASRQDALSAKAAAHLNLASLVAESLGQLVDRAQAVGRMTQDDLKGLRQDNHSLARLLAVDPVFKRMCLYDRQGRLRSASHGDEATELPADWLQQLRLHVARYGFKPFLPRITPDSNPGAMPNWRLPFLLPLTDLQGREIDHVLVVQLDIGYLAVLFQHIDLGNSGLMRLLQDNGVERLRIDSRGVVVADDSFEPGLQGSDSASGLFTQYAAGTPYQSVYRRVAERGFSVVVSQGHDEILAPSALAYTRQFWLNLSMTLMILASLAWTLRLLRKRQEAFSALEHAQQVNQQLIGRLEDEHRRSSHAAATDHLSGLHNRRQFVEVAGQALTRQRGKRQLMAILFIDMDRFIDLAERSGFIVELGWEVLRLACEELARWNAQGRESRLAVNVSALQLRQGDFSSRLLAKLQRHGIAAQRLELEITETTILDPEGTAVEHLQRLRAAGLGISLDDFGRGYAGFAHLQSLPLSKLKIDRALIAPLSNSYDDSPIVSSTIILAKRLGLEVVAEGVETREQVVCLKLAGCDIAQGYHFSRPLSPVQLREYPPFNGVEEKSCML